MSVVYLQDNEIKCMENLNGLKNLTHLYLQNNRIEKIENLESLINLTKLYLNDNCITVVENLHNNINLTELHVENQHFEPCEQLLFDPNTLKTLSKCVQILNISKNNMNNLLDLICLHQLVSLNASTNQLNDLKQTVHVVNKLPNLVQLDLSSNPICKQPHYRKGITTMAARLGEFEGGNYG
uniref:Protein phosphatase 1 regulatory subunit 7 n=1 Tax=Strigamia maritima TaxID=126957 RepID=T1JCT7_STRMM